MFSLILFRRHGEMLQSEAYNWLYTVGIGLFILLCIVLALIYWHSKLKDDWETKKVRWTFTRIWK